MFTPLLSRRYGGVDVDDAMRVRVAVVNRYIFNV
jgi:hypothetical protein